MQEELNLQYIPSGLENDFSHFSRALAHPARVTILLEIMKSNGVVEGRVVDVPGMSPSTVIQHLREMKKSSIIEGRIFGMRSKYWISNESLQFFRNISLEFFTQFDALI
jgi:predicted transcriptional regulator